MCLRTLPYWACYWASWGQGGSTIGQHRIDIVNSYLLITHLTQVGYAHLFVLIIHSPKTCCAHKTLGLRGCSVASQSTRTEWEPGQFVREHVTGRTLDSAQSDDYRSCRILRADLVAPALWSLSGFSSQGSEQCEHREFLGFSVRCLCEGRWTRRGGLLYTHSPTSLRAPCMVGHRKCGGRHSLLRSSGSCGTSKGEVGVCAMVDGEQISEFLWGKCSLRKA